MINFNEKLSKIDNYFENITTDYLLENLKLKGAIIESVNDIKYGIILIIEDNDNEIYLNGDLNVKNKKI